MIRSVSGFHPLFLRSVDRCRDRNTGERQERTAWHRVVTFQPGLIDMLKKHARKGRLVYVYMHRMPISVATTGRDFRSSVDYGLANRSDSREPEAIIELCSRIDRFIRRKTSVP